MAQPGVAAASANPDAERVRELMEYYARANLTDGLPVVPVTEPAVAEFLGQTDRDPGEVLMAMPHLNRECTINLAAVNAVMAGCLPEYFPVILAAWDALALEPYPVRGIWQSTTGTAPFLIVNGPVRERIGLNSSGNIFGSGFRANATVGRAIRLTAINVFGLHPHELDQSTQATPAKYSACIAENEEESPWVPLHVECGLASSDSAVTAMTIRSVVHIEARHTSIPEQLALDITDTLARTGALLHEFTNGFIVLGPEHARLFGDAGWTKADLRQFVFDHGFRTRSELAAVGKDAISPSTHWRVPGSHPDAVPDQAAAAADPGQVPVLRSPDSVQVVVAGANNAGVSAVVEVFGSGSLQQERPASTVRVQERGAPPVA
jgi:hypothetical protein